MAALARLMRWLPFGLFVSPAFFGRLLFQRHHINKKERNVSDQFTPGYEVTLDGKVFSTKSNWRGYGRRELVQVLNAHGYPSVRIIISGVRKHLAVHSLVAMYYLPARPSPLHQVRHLDGDKMNSYFQNLSWGTAKENADDRARHCRTSRGDRHSKAIKLGWAARNAILKATGSQHDN